MRCRGLVSACRGREGAANGRIIFEKVSDARGADSVICDRSSCDQTRDTPPETTMAMMLALSASSAVTRSRATTTRQPSHVYENGT
jgi:hypothetical protein